jgi:hypothetical protein
VEDQPDDGRLTLYQMNPVSSTAPQQDDGRKGVHFAPAPHARARSGCWIIFKLYVIFLPSRVIRLTEYSVSLGGAMGGGLAVAVAISTVSVESVYKGEGP